MSNQSRTQAATSRSRAMAFLRRAAGPLWRRVGFTAVLTVPGRRTGSPTFRLEPSG